MNDLLFSVGLDVADLKTSAKVAKEQADDIKRGFKGFKDVLEFGGVGAAVLGFFKSVIDYANDLKGPLDENTAAVRRFSEGLTATKEGFLSAGAQFMGFFNRAGEGLGALVRSMIDGKEAVKQAAQIERESAEAIAKIEAEKKKNGEDYKRIKEQMASLEKEAEQIQLKQLTNQEQFNLAAQKYEELVRRLGSEQLTTLERRQLELELQKTSVDVLKTDAALKKETADEQKKAVEAEAKSRKEHNELIDKKLKLQFDALSTDKQVAALVRDEEALRKTIAQFKRLGLDTTEQEVALLETQERLGKVRETQAKELTAETARQVEEQKRVTEELARQAQQKDFLQKIEVRKGRSDTDLTDRELAEKIANARRNITALEQSDPMGKYRGLGFLDQQTLDSALAEQRTRSEFRRLYEREGESAFRRYSAFDEDRLRQYIRPEDEKRAAKQAADIADIAQRIANIVSK